MSKTDGIEGVSARDDFLTQMGGRQFSTVLADPPWQFQNRTGKVAPEHRRLNRYSTMVLDDIKALPVRFWNCQGGSANTVENCRPPTCAKKSSRALTPSMPSVFDIKLLSNSQYQGRATTAAAALNARQQPCHVGGRRAIALTSTQTVKNFLQLIATGHDDANADGAKLEQQGSVF